MNFRPLAIAALFVAAALAPASAQDTADRAWFENAPTPVRYDISVTPDMEAATFTGETTITIESDRTLPSVVMNALDIEVTRAIINNQTVTAVVDNEAQTLTLTPRRPLRAGRHTIRIDYNGTIFDDAYGLFRVEYDQDGQTRRALATQFEVGDARRFSPMWDQPNMRSVFSVAITAPSDLMPVGNMPVASATRLANGMTRTRFQDTPSMASYLLFLGLGDFERITTDVDGVELGVIVRRGQTERAHYAMQAGVESLRYFEEYFGVEYPLPKLDMVAVPGAGGFAAMENWGAILYFDQYILVDDDRTSEAERRFVFEVVAHEIAHQWFGNLVTMRWWNDLWLNEGFASWAAAKAAEELHPEWQPWLSQRAGGTESAMGLDARAGTHPVVQTVNTIDEANLAFDAISYEKGLAVIRMLEGYVGEEDFRRGVHDYLSARLYGNSVTDDLWGAIQAASGQPVLDIARGFTLQPGYPVLEAEAQCAGAGNTIAVRQHRFAYDDAARTDELWSIPVVAAPTRGGAQRSVLPASATGAVTLAGACDGYLLNAGQSGFFRVLYAQADFERIVRDFAQLEDADQLGVMLDYWAFGRSDAAPLTQYLELVNVMPADANPVVVMDAASSLGAVAGFARGRESEAAVRAYGLRILQPYFARWGWEPRDDEHPNVRLARPTLISTLGALGDESVLAEARRRVAAADAGDTTALHGTIRTAARALIASRATEAEYDALVARARAQTDFVEQRRSWLLLASNSNEALARRTLALTQGEDIPRQIRPQVIQTVAGSHPRLAWDFLVANRAMVESMLDPLQRLEYASGIAAQSSDPEIADALIEYGRDTPSARDSIESTASNIRIREQLAERTMPAVDAWIAAHTPAEPRRRRR